MTKTKGEVLASPFMFYSFSKSRNINLVRNLRGWLNRSSFSCSSFGGFVYISSSISFYAAKIITISVPASKMRNFFLTY